MFGCSYLVNSIAQILASGYQTIWLYYMFKIKTLMYGTDRSITRQP